MHVSIETLIDRFPDLRIAVVVAGDLSILETASPALADEIAAIEAKATARYADVGMGDIPGVADWRRAYRAIGIKKTSYRCSVERLIRKTMRDGALARINPFVDAYNAVSLKRVFPLGPMTSQTLPVTSVFGSHKRATRSMRWVRPRQRTTRPNQERSSTPMTRRSCAAAGTGIRTPAAPSRRRPQGRL